MPTSEIIVQKYGGATLADPEKIKQVAKRIFELHQTGSKVVVIVSAMGQTTNGLIDLAHQVSKRPPLRELDMLLTVGERISMALLSMALNDLGCSAISFTGSQAGIITDDSHINANIVEVKAFRVDEALQKNKIVILAGFQGVSQNTKEITTLGRGGSDISAVAIAGYLNANQCEILKDVAGVYTADPKLVPAAKPIDKLNYSQLLEMTMWGAKVLHYNSVKLAADKKINLFIGSAADKSLPGTLINSQTTFSNQSVLGINSFAKIYNIKFDTSKEAFQKFLQDNQIGQLQLLLDKPDAHYYTGPQETLQSLELFEKQQGYFKINNNELSSVTATYSKEVTDQNLLEAKEILKKHNIDIYESFLTNYSVHFFVKSEQRNATIQQLNELVK